jgi:Ca2+-binding RTX toxin-like protein
MSATEFPKGIVPSTLKNLLKPLSLWASKSSAEADLESIFGPRLDWASAFKHIAAFRRVDFSLLPVIRTLPATDMPGLWGGYSRDTREIYLSADCPQELLSAVLIEEIGHFLDQELCSEETPGEEGARFAAAVLGLPLDSASSDDSLAPLFLQGRELLVEAARKSRGSSKSGKSASKSGRKKRGSSNGSGSNSGGGTGYAEVGSKSSNPKLQESIIYATQDSARIPQKAAGNRLVGSRGNDTFVVTSQDVRIEDPTGGTDTVESSVTFSLATHSTIENLLLTGGGNINGTGNLKANVITGNSGNNKLDGGTDSAIDTLQGGSGNDTYVLRDTLDQIVEAVGSGTDTIETTQSSFSMANYANVENLAYSGTGIGVTFTGNSGNNALTGTDGADSLDGSDGIDTLNGGKGDDIYIVDNSFDIILDDSGIDSVYTRASSYTLGGGLENLFNAKDDSDATLVGNSDDNSIKGGSGNDSLYGGAGNDTLLTSSERDSDILNGGRGDDFYILSSDNNVTFIDEEGIDTVLASVNHELSKDIENLTFVQSNTDKNPVYDPTSDISNSISTTSTRIYPNGKPLLSDFNSVSDVDVVAVKLSKGSTYEFKISGDISEEGFYDLGVNLQLLDGSGRVLYSAYDYYFDDYATIKFTAGTPADYYLRVDPFYFFTRYNSGKYELTAVTTEFADALNGTGNDLANKITGNAGNNLLIGEGGNDTLDGGTSDRQTFDGGSGGLDTFNGGPGNDFFLNWNEQDRIVEAASADRTKNIDTIISSKLDFSAAIYLGRNDLLNVENFIWEGEESISVIGNFLNNSLTSQQNSNDILSGGAGDDFITAGGGDDLLDAGYFGSFYFNRSFIGIDLITSEASSGKDTLVGGDGSDTYIVDNKDDRIIESFGPGLDEVRALVSYTLPNSVSTLGDNGLIEDLVAISASANSLTGNDIDNRIEAFAGTNSTLDGGDGADVLVGKSGNDSLYGGLGSDLLQGGLGDDTLNAGNDSLNADYMQGGLGNDLYVLNDSPAFIEEGLNEGIDAVQASVDYTLDLNLENLIIVGSASVKGTGNELDNFISGNSVANTLYGLAGADILSGSTLAGDDYLDGGEGADLLLGGAGNDTLTGGTIAGGVRPYNDDGSVDTLRGGSGSDLFLIYSRQDDFDGEAGKDTVYTSVTNFDTRNLTENLYLGSGEFVSLINYHNDKFYGGFTDTDSLKGFGDAQNNLLVGNAGHNLLDGAGALGGDTLLGDTLVGGEGSDTIIVYTEKDWVFADDLDDYVIFYSDSVSLFGGIENFIGSTLRLEVIGQPTEEGDSENPSGNDFISGRLISDTINGLSGDDTILGGGANDSLYGNDGNDYLDGEEGFDTLVGGEGNDFFVSGGGEDTFIGGNGNDVYQINWDAPDKLIETSLSDGTDTILTNGNFSLAPKTSGFVSANDQNPYLFIENLVYQGSSGVSLTGNTRSNSIQGGTGADTLDGGISFIIDQGDTLSGGTGNDLYIIRNRYDRIIELGSDNDIDTVHTYINFDPLDSEDRNNVTRNTSFASKDIQYFARLDHFVFMGDVIRGVGNARDNSFTGNYENNVILGLAGDDTILGNVGNDSLYGDADNTTSLSGNSTLDGSGSSYGYDSLTGSYPFNPGDYVSSDTLLVGDVFPMRGQDYLDGGDGNDLLSGNGGSDTLLGGAGSDILDGGSEVDSMVGGAGDDIYYSDMETDTILELADEGNDIIFSTKNIHFIQDNLENAVIYGSEVRFAVGNSLDNIISVSQKTGDVGAVTLFGGEGNDKLYGYYGKGVRGYASLKADMDDDKDRNVGDYLVGGAGNDLLDGGKGVDTLEGGLGNDTIYVDNTYDDGDTSTYDKIWEFGYEGDPGNGGTDWVISKVDIDLKDIYTNDGLFNISLPDDQLKYVENGMFIENLMGASTSGQTLSGNWLNNTIVGGVGADSISGEEGKDFLANNRKPTVFSIDTLTGGAGGDTFSLVDYSDGVSALYADEFTSLSFFGVDSSYAYITDFSSDKLFLPTVLPDLNGDGQAAKGFVYADLTNPHTGLLTIGLYIYDVKTDSAGDPAYRYNLIAMGDNLI